jgi:hypothetical protein
MSETTGGNSGATGGGSAGGSQVETLALGIQVPGAEQAVQLLDNFEKGVIKVGTATVRSMTSIGDLNKALDENAQWTDRSRSSWAQLNQSVNAAYEADQKALQVTLARIDAATKFEAKLQEMVATYGFSKTEMLAYQAAELGVLDSTKGLIDTLDRLTESQRQNAIQQQRDIEMYRESVAEQDRQRKIQESRDMWEHEQRTKKYNDYVAFWEKTLSTQEANDARYLKAEQDRVDREKEIQQQRDVWLNNQRQKDRASYEQWWNDQLKQQDSALKKQLDLDIAYGEKSLKQKIDMLQKIAAYQADPRTSQTGTDLTSMFGAKAVGDVSKLDQMIKEYNDTLGKHGKKLKETGDQVSVWNELLGNARIRTEGLVLAHELLQGRFTRFGGSLGVMLEYLSSANISIGAFAIGVGATIGTVIGLTYELAKGQEQFKELANAVERTNGFAGESAGGFDALAHSVAQAHGNFKEAYEAVTQLANSGRFTSDQIRLISDSVVSLNHVMGTDMNSTIKEFESLSVRSTSNSAKGNLEVAVALEKLDQKYHFVNATLLETVIALEKQGKAAEASQLAIHAYADETKRAAEAGEENIGYLEASWTKVLGVIHAIGQGIADIGKTSLEIREAKLVEVLQAELPKDRNNPGAGIETDESKLTKGQIDLLHQYYDIENQLELQRKRTDAQAEERRKQSEADHVLIQRGIQDRSLLKKSVNELDAALQDNSEQLTKLLAADPAYLDDPKNQAYEDDRLEAIIKAHTQKVKAVKDDGRKEDLLSQLQHEDAILKQQMDSDEAQLRAVRDQYKKSSISQEEFYQRSSEARKKELEDIEANEKAKLAILDRYQPKNKVDERNVAKRRQQVIDEYNIAKANIDHAQELADQKNNEAQYDKWINSINKLGDAEVKEIEKLTKKQEEHNLAIGKTAAQLDLAKRAQDDAATAELEAQANAIDALLTKGEVQRASIDGIQDEETAVVQLDARSRQVYEAELARIRKLIQARKDYAASLDTGTQLEEQFAVQKKVDAEWVRTNKKIGDDLASAIVDGGGRGWKKMIRDMEIAFAKVVLQPILAPISAGISSYLYPTATQAGGVASVGGTNPLGQYVSAAQSASNLYKAASGGFQGIGASIGSGVSAVGNFFGSSAISSFGSGMGMTAEQAAAASQAYAGAGYATEASSIQYGQVAGSYAAMAAGAYIGRALGDKIANGYSIGNHGQAITNTGTAIGTGIGYYLGGPIGGAVGGFIGGTVGGLANRAFGRGPTEVRSQGIRGTLDDSGTVGTTYQDLHQDGGWFRSDKNWTDSKAIDKDTSAIFTNGFKLLEASSLSLAKNLGVADNALAGYSKKFDIKLTGDATKDQQAVTDFFTGLGDEIANKLVPKLSQFALAGESAGTTLQRLSDEFEATNQAAKLLGVSTEKMFGSAGVDSAAAREKVLNYSGGASNLTSQAQFFQQNYLTEAERLAPVAESLNTALSSLGLKSIPQTREQFKLLVQDLVTSGQVATDAGAKEYASLMALADAFAQVHPATVDTTLTLTQAQSDLTGAYKDQVQAITTANDKMSSFAKTLRSLNTSTLLGDLSPLTPEQKYAQAKSQFDSISKKASSGDADAQAAFTGAYQDFLSSSRTVNASNSTYQSDFQYAQKTAEDLAKYATSQVDVGTQQLDVLKKQVDGLITINDSVMSVADGIQEVIKALGVNGAGGVQNLYETILGHAANADAMQYWMAQMSSGTTLDQIATRLKQRGENATLDNPELSSGVSVTIMQNLLKAVAGMKLSLDSLRTEQATQTGDSINAQVETAQATASSITGAINSLVQTAQSRVSIK